MNRINRMLAASAVFGFALGGAAVHGQWEEILKKGREALGDTTPKKQIAHFAIKGSLVETPAAIPPLFGGEPPLSLGELLERFRDARHDDNVVAVVVDLQEAAMGAGQLEEVHAALRAFKAADKPVFVHADLLTTLTYAAATGASHISLVPSGELWLTGLYGETPYLRGTLDKIGCVPDFEQFEDYKSAAEIFTRTEPSPASREMTTWLLDGLYNSLVQRMAESRSVTPDKMKQLVDAGPYSAEEALAAGLIDSVRHRQDFIFDLGKRYGSDVEIVTDYGFEDEFKPPSDPFAMINWFMQLLNPAKKGYSDPTIAIVHVEGAILPGAAEPSPFGGSSGAFSTTIRKALDKAAAERAIRAVVLRVDSPGGSALASEIILDATQRVASKKPLIVSMGNVAGSGGYYVSCGADAIFADAMTITASIGVIGGKIVTTGMWDKLGVNWHAEQRGKMAALLSSAKPFDDAEREKIRHYMKTIYEIFKGHVTKFRGDKLAKPIEKIAGGRVFTGQQALELGLVDRIGGLDDAIKFAAQKAGVGEYDIRVIPEPLNLFDLLSGKSDKEYAWSLSRLDGGLAGLAEVRAMLLPLAAFDPLRVQAILRSLVRIELIHKESVITMMPQEWIIR